MLRNCLFFSLALRSGLGAAIADALARSSIVLCNSVSADRIVVSGCVKVAWCPGCMRNTIVFCSWISQIVLEWLHQGCDSDLSADFSILALVIFLVKFLFKKCFKIVFFSLAPRSIRFWSCNSYCHYVQESFSVYFFSVKACCFT